MGKLSSKTCRVSFQIKLLRSLSLAHDVTVDLVTRHSPNLLCNSNNIQPAAHNRFYLVRVCSVGVDYCSHPTHDVIVWTSRKLLKHATELGVRVGSNILSGMCVCIRVGISISVPSMKFIPTHMRFTIRIHIAWDGLLLDGRQMSEYFTQVLVFKSR